jgi:hypothetical protein
MRFLARFGLGLCGLALLACPMAKAGGSPAPDGGSAAPQVVQAPGHQHKGLFGWRHCVECQRTWVKKMDGVDVPPPPSILPGGALPGQVVSGYNQAAGCAACQSGGVVTGPVTVVESYPPGHSVVGGPTVVENYGPGYAVVGGPSGPVMAGADPAPVGVSRSGQPRWNGPRMATTGPRAGTWPYDPSVLPSSMIPAQTGLDGASTGRPHVLTHMVGIGGMARHLREAREDRRREAHASISYNPPAQPVNELPANLVYDRKH